MKILKSIEGNRTYILLVCVMTITTFFVGVMLYRVYTLPSALFSVALPGAASMIGEFGFLLLSGLFGYAASKGGSALKAWSYWSNQQNQRGNESGFRSFDSRGDYGFDGHNLHDFSVGDGPVLAEGESESIAKVPDDAD